MARSVFAVSSAVPILARIPLLSADVCGPAAGADALLTEGMFLASRHVEHPAKHPERIDERAEQVAGRDCPIAA